MSVSGFIVQHLVACWQTLGQTTRGQHRRLQRRADYMTQVPPSAAPFAEPYRLACGLLSVQRRHRAGHALDQMPSGNYRA